MTVRPSVRKSNMRTVATRPRKSLTELSFSTFSNDPPFCLSIFFLSRYPASLSLSDRDAVMYHGISMQKKRS